MYIYIYVFLYIYTHMYIYIYRIAINDDQHNIVRVYICDLSTFMSANYNGRCFRYRPTLVFTNLLMIFSFIKKQASVRRNCCAKHIIK